MLQACIQSELAVLGVGKVSSVSKVASTSIIVIRLGSRQFCFCLLFLFNCRQLDVVVCVVFASLSLSRQCLVVVDSANVCESISFNESEQNCVLQVFSSRLKLFSQA